MLSILRHRGGFFRDVATLLTGTLISRVIMFAALPILSRIYTPAEFGVLALFTLTVTTIACVATGRYEVAVLLPEDARSGAHLAVAALFVAACSSVCAALFFYPFRYEIAELLGASELSFWLMISPIIIWVLCAGYVFESWITRHRKFGYIGAGEVTGTTVNVGTQITLDLLFKAGSAGLIIGQISYMLTSMSVFLFGALKTGLPDALRGFDRRLMWSMMRQYRNFPLFDTWANFLSLTAREFQILALGVFFSSTIVGFYSVGYRIVSTPAVLVSRSISRVFLPKARASLGAGDLDRVTRQLIRQLLVFSLTPAMLAAAAASELIVIFLGATWAESAVYVQWLCLFMTFHFISIPLGQLFLVLERQQERLTYQVALVVTRLGGLILGGMLGDPVLAVALASCLGAATIFVAVIIVLRYAGIPGMETLRLFLAELIRAVPFALVLVAATRFVDGNWAAVGLFVLALSAFVALRFKSLTGSGS